jgi:hypothetical protein
MNFLFDLVNHISGYSEKFYEETVENMDHEDLISKYRAERKRCEDKTISIDNESTLLGNLFPHSLMVLEGVDQFLKMNACNLKVQAPER